MEVARAALALAPRVAPSVFFNRFFLIDMPVSGSASGAQGLKLGARRTLNKIKRQLFGILNFGDCDLFGICDLKFFNC